MSSAQGWKVNTTMEQRTGDGATSAVRHRWKVLHNLNTNQYKYKYRYKYKYKYSKDIPSDDKDKLTDEKDKPSDKKDKPSDKKDKQTDTVKACQSVTVYYPDSESDSDSDSYGLLPPGYSAAGAIVHGKC